MFRAWCEYLHRLACPCAGPEPEKFEDQYEDALKELLKKKRAGEKIEAPKPRESSNVVDLMDALRESLKVVEKRGDAEPEARKPRAASRLRTAKKASRSGARKKAS